MQTRWSTGFSKITILVDEPCRIRVVIPGTEVDQPGVFIVFLAGEYLAVEGGAGLVADVAPGVELVADLDGALVGGEVDRGAEGVVVVILVAGVACQAEKAMGIAIVGKQGVIGGAVFF